MILPRLPAASALARFLSATGERALRCLPGLAALLAAPTLATASPGWYPFVIQPEPAAAFQPAALPTPAALTAADQIRALGSHFYRIGPDLTPGTADDERVRFFGVNLSFDAAIPDTARAQALARTLAKLGVNAVRLHHLDTRQTPGHTTPRGVLTNGPYPSWHPEGLQRLRSLITALAEVGIYTNLNLRVGYRFRPEIDGIPFYDAESMRRPHATPIAVYTPQLVALQQRYARELIDALGLRNHPALALVEISNEASLLASWYRNEWQDAVPAAYAPVLEQRWNAWLLHRYGSLQAACQAWPDCTQTPALAYLPSPADVFTPESTLGHWLRQATNRGTAWLNANLNWPDHPATTSPISQRAHDFLQFLASEDARYFAQMKAAIQQAAGFPVPVTGTQMGYGGPLNHVALQAMDYLDDHFYVDHPHFPQGHGGQENWRIWNLSLRQQEAELLLRHALRREWGKPFVVSEYNQPYPSQFGGEILPLFVSLAARQDWDGVFFFEYANGAVVDAAPANFALEGDWGKWVQLAQAARLFRATGPLPLADARTLALSEADLTRLTGTGKLDAPSQLARSRLGLEPADVWRYPIGSHWPNPSPAGISPSAARGGKLYEASVTPTPTRWWLQHPEHQINIGVAQPTLAAPSTPLSYSAEASHLPVTLWLTAIPDTTLPTWQLTLGSATVGSQPGAAPPRPKRYLPHPAGSGATLEPDPASHGALSASRHAAAPAWLPLLPLQVHWQTATANQRLRVYPLDAQGQRMAALPDTRIVQRADGYTVSLHATPEEASPWFEWVLEPERP